MDAVMQWVRTSWTKRCRGGTEAARRNAAPVAFILPVHAAPLVHVVNMREADDFQPEGSLQKEPGEDVLLRAVDGRLRVELVANPFGMPRRWRRPPAVLLRRGEWVRWQINYRFVGSCGDWSYRLDTLNLANGTVPVDAFLTEPVHQVDERALLR